jgi:protein gp37
MGLNSAIEWTHATWNPVTGCDRVSPGCDHCYALTLAKRLKAMGNPRYGIDGHPKTSGPGFGVTLHLDKLTEPLRWRRPRLVFVNSMSDLFHSKVPAEFIALVFASVLHASEHSFQILTKRPRRMRNVLGGRDFRDRVAHHYRKHVKARGIPPAWWPVSNVWLGVSVEDQEWADRRIPLLHETSAAVRFLSCEPLIGPINLTPYLAAGDCTRHYGDAGTQLIDWVIVGGESGASARPMRAGG